MSARERVRAPFQLMTDSQRAAHARWMLGEELRVRCNRCGLVTVPQVGATVVRVESHVVQGLWCFGSGQIASEEDLVEDHPDLTLGFLGFRL